MAPVKLVQTAPRSKAAPVTAPSADVATANSRLADAAHKIGQEQKAATKAAKATSPAMAGLPALPKLPASARKPKASKPCECGCAGPTKGGRFIPGHDARLHAWALRVTKGVVKAEDVPAPHTAAVAAYLASKAAKA